MHQDTFDSDAETEPSVKLCECGCGEPAPLAKWNDKRKGHVKGQPVRFVPGHNAALPMPSFVEPRPCECGCGQLAPIAKESHPGRGIIKGQPMRFVFGHGANGRRTGRKRSLFVEVGQRIGRGVVLEAEIRVPFEFGRNTTARGARLLCDCGTEYEARIPLLVGSRPQVKSCGCLMRQRSAENRAKAWEVNQGRHRTGWIDLAGQRFGRLVVLRETERPIPFGNQNISWVCRCDCGGETEAQTGSLRSGGVRSCGCLMQDRVLPPGEVGRNSLLGKYRYGARTRGLSWELSDEEFDRLTSSDCFYCGYPPSQNCGDGNSRYVYNGIDRIDNDLGYTPGNVCTACAQCNRSKSDLPFDTFMEWIGRLVAHQWLRPEMLPSAAISRPALRVVNPGDVA